MGKYSSFESCLLEVQGPISNIFFPREYLDHFPLPPFPPLPPNRPLSETSSDVDLEHTTEFKRIRGRRIRERIVLEPSEDSEESECSECRDTTDGMHNGRRGNGGGGGGGGGGWVPFSRGKRNANPTGRSTRDTYPNDRTERAVNWRHGVGHDESPGRPSQQQPRGMGYDPYASGDPRNTCMDPPPRKGSHPGPGHPVAMGMGMGMGPDRRASMSVPPPYTAHAPSYGHQYPPGYASNLAHYQHQYQHPHGEPYPGNSIPLNVPHPPGLHHTFPPSSIPNKPPHGNLIHIPNQSNEWHPTPNPFLDACACKTTCHCRQGTRILYREQTSTGEQSSGEIRYILKSQVGQDCSDGHDHHHRASSGSDSSKKDEKETRAAEIKAAVKAELEVREKKRRKKEEMREVLRRLDRLDLERKGRRGSGRGSSVATGGSSSSSLSSSSASGHVCVGSPGPGGFVGGMNGVSGGVDIPNPPPAAVTAAVMQNGYPPHTGFPMNPQVYPQMPSHRTPQSYPQIPQHFDPRQPTGTIPTNIPHHHIIPSDIHLTSSSPPHPYAPTFPAGMHPISPQPRTQLPPNHPPTSRSIFHHQFGDTSVMNPHPRLPSGGSRSARRALGGAGLFPPPGDEYARQEDRRRREKETQMVPEQIHTDINGKQGRRRRRPGFISDPNQIQEEDDQGNEEDGQELSHDWEDLGSFLGDEGIEEVSVEKMKKSPPVGFRGIGNGGGELGVGAGVGGQKNGIGEGEKGKQARVEDGSEDLLG